MGEKEEQRSAYNQLKHKSSSISNFLNLDLKTFKLFKKKWPIHDDII